MLLTLLLINFNKESRMHLFDAEAGASPFFLKKMYTPFAFLWLFDVVRISANPVANLYL
jgi:hypothetical protein